MKILSIIITLACIVLLLALIHYILTLASVKTILRNIYENISNVKLRSILRTLYYVVLKITEPFYIVIKAIVDYLKSLI